MLNSLRDGQINYGTTNCQSAHVPPHNVVAPIHQNSLISTEPTTPVYQWNANHRLEHLYGFHSRYYNLDFPTPYPPATNQYVPANVYGQNLPQCCQPCCRLRSQNMPKASPPQVLYNPRPVQQLNRSYKSKKTLKTPCSEQFLPYIPNDLPVKYDTQNCYQQKYNSSYLNNTNYCPPDNNLWIPPAANPNWSTDRLRPIGRHTSVVSHDFSREKNNQRLPNYQSNPYLKPTSGTHHIPYNYIPPIPDVHDYRPPIYHNALKNNTTEYVSHDHNSRLPISSQNIQNAPSLQQYYNTQPVPYSDVQLPNSESFKPPQIAPKDNSKSNLNVREFLATWDEGEEEIAEKSSETTEPIVVLDCMTLDGDALTKIQEKLNVVSYENLEKVLKENQNPLVITTEPNEINSFNNKPKLPSKSNFEPLDYTKRETGIIKPFNTEKKTSSGSNVQPGKSYSVNFDGMVAWYGKKNADISSTDLIEKLADRIFNLSKSQENDGVSFGTAAYTGQITQTNRSIESSDKNTSKYIQSSQMFDLQHHVDKCIEHPLMNKMSCNKDSIPRVNSFTLNESDKSSTVKSNNANSSCIVENITKRCLNVTNEDTTPWHLDQGVQEQHLNTSLYDHSVIIKPLDFSSLTDETKGNPFVFEKITSNNIKPNDSINNQCNKVFNEHNSYNSTVSNNQHSIQQIDTVNRNFPVIVSPHRPEYNGFHESVIQRTGCDKNKHDKVSTQTDFESINWNLSNDLDKIMKNENMGMEPSCLYDRNNYNILDSMNSDKNVSTRWKDNVPCVDLTVNCKTNPHHDSFFDGWSFIDSYENHTSKKIMNTSSNDNSHHSLFPNQMTSLEESTKNNNNSSENTDDTFKDVPPFSKSNDLSPTNRQSRDVFNLNNRIPDFSDGFELSAINEPHEYLQFKKDDNEHRADGSIFEHLNEPKCVTTLNETLTYKNDQNKLDFIGLPSFKEKEPLAPVSAPSKLNIVKPTLRDPSQTYTVIKQKLKYNNTCADNDSVVTNKTENNLKEHLTNSFNVTDLKSKYNGVQLNQFDVWSEKFVLKGNSNSSSSAVVQCDVEITQFKSTPENRNSLPKSNMNENYQDKTMILPENTNCNLAADKINIIEHDKINSNDFLHCLENTKTNDQKYQDTFDEFETSFGFDIHCNNESNKPFHEDIVDKCFEERIKDQIEDRNINKVESNNTSNSNTSSNNTQLPFQCDFQSSYLIKNYFDENKNKTVNLNQKQTNYQDKSDTTAFKYHDQNVQEFELENNENIHSVINSEKNSNFIMDTDIEEIQKSNENNNSNLINEDKSCENKHENTNNIREISSIKNNNFDYLNVEDRNLKFNDNKKSIQESTISKEKVVNNSSVEANIISQIKQNDLNSHKLFHIRKNSNIDFELNNINANIFESNSKSTSIVSSIEANKNNILGSPKNSFELKYNSDNIEKIERNINKKNIFELDNNNISIHNLEKMDEFDFNTRIIQNLGIECSSVDVEKPTSSNERFTNENQIKASCGFEINDNGNKVKLETNYKNTLGVQEKLRIGETSDLNCNNDIQCHDVIETENINCENKVDRIFEIGCIVNNIQEKQILDNPKPQTDFITLNENAEKFNLNNCNTKVENNSEVENIFENIYDNLSTLDSVKNDTNILDQDDLKRNASKCLEITKYPSLKNKNSDGVDEPNMDVFHNASEETFDETNNVLLQELVNNSVDRLTTVSVPHNESMNDVKSKSTLLEYSTDENLAISVEQLTKDIEEGKRKLNNVTNRESIKNLTANKVKSDAKLTLFENLKSDLFNTTKNADKKYHAFELTSQQNPNEMHEVKDSTYSGAYLLSHVEMTHHQNSNQIIEIKELMNCGPSILNHNESISKQPSLENVEAVDLTSSGPISLNHHALMTQPIEMFIAKNSKMSRLTSLNHDKSKPQQNPNKIYEIEESISTGLSSLNRTDLISKQNSNAITNGVDNSINYDYSLLSHNELKCQQYSDKRVENEDSNSSLKHDELQHHQNINKINEIEDSTSPELSSIKQDKIDLPKNSNTIYEAEDLTRSNPTSINQNELNYYQNLNEDEDSINSGPCSIKQDEFELQKNSNAINDLEDLTISETSSINQDELEIPKNSNAINDLEDLVDNSESCSINQDKLEFQRNENEIYEAEDLSRSRHISINQDELKIPKNLNAIDEPEDLVTSESCSINQDKLEFQRNENEIYENEDSISSGSRSINQDELEYHKHLNEINEDEDSTSFGSSSINQDELEKPKNSNAIDNPEDLVTSESCSINQDKLEFQQNTNEIIENEDSIISRPSSINQDELEYHKSLNGINEDGVSTSSGPSSINQDELEKPKNSNAINDLEDLVDNYKSCSINQDELEFQKNANEIYEAEDLTRFRPSSINQDKLKLKHNLNEIYDSDDDLTTSRPSLINQDELEIQKNSKVNDEPEDLVSSEYCSTSQDKLEFQQNTNEIYEAEDLARFKPSSINQDELEFQQNTNEIYEDENLAKSKPSSINQDELELQHNSNDIYDSDDMTTSRPSLINQDELEIQKNSKVNDEPEDLVSSKSCSINQGKLEFQQNTNEIYEAEDLARFKPSSINQDELEYHKSLNGINEDGVSTSSGPSSINQDELEKPKNSNAINDLEDLVDNYKSCSINQDELEFQKNANEIYEAEDLTRFRPSSINQDKLKLKHNLNEIYDSDDDLTTSRPSLINQDELEIQKNSKVNDEPEDLVSSEYCSTSQDKLEFQQNTNEIYEAEDLARFKPSSINQDELEFQQNTNEIYEDENLAKSKPSSINQDELELQHNSNDIYDSDDMTISRPSLINQDELEIQKNSKVNDEPEDLVSSKSCSINQGKLEFQQNTNEIYEAEDLARFKPSSINQDELEYHKNLNEIYEDENSTSSGSSSINQDELEYHKNLNEIYEDENSTGSGSSSINQDKLEKPKNTNAIDNPEDLVSSEYCSINQDKLEFQQNANEINEAVDLTISRPSLLNHVDYKSQHDLNKIVKDKDLIGSVESLLKANCDTYIEPKSVVNNIKLSKVKFMLKCHNRNMIKTNVFEEPTVPCKKLKVAKDEKLMSHHIFKKRNTCYKQCTSLQSMYKKELNIELNDNNLKDLIKNTDIPLITIYPDNIAQVVRTPSEGEQYDSKFVSLVDQMYDHDGKQNDEVEVKSDTSDDDEYIGPLITPIPSPFDDFQSENTTPEHCSGEVYWDKSLEDEYKSVLHKTISKLAKVRVNVRDKFNSRLLARRVIETKRRKRDWQQRQLLVADKTAVVIVGHVEDTVKPVVTAVKVSTSPMYKIKVQLPWDRIFNMNGPKGSRNKTKDTTKIELGPAKVEVRLSQTPGEWQVAACQPLTSPKSVMFVRRLVLQRAASPVTNDCDVDDHYHNHRQDDNGHDTNDNRSHDLSRKLPKIVIRRNGQDNNYTSYVSSSGFENGDADNDGGNDDKNDNGGGVPQLMVRLVRDRKLDAMAVEGVTTLHLKHLVPISESKIEASVEMDMHCAKRVRYS